MIGALLAGGAAASLLLAAHPFTTYPMSLRLLARRHAVPTLGGAPPTRLAMCVCAYNEEAVIAARVENMLALRARHPGLDILVYVDAASDGTARVLEAYHDRIRVVVSPERHGKTYGMNLLVSMTDAEVIVFSDANVTFAADAIEKLVAPFADPAVGCSCGHLVYVDGDAATSTAAAGSLYWRLEEYIKALESETGSVMGADGSIFALRRSIHRPPPPYLIDDMFVSLSALCAGSRIVRVADAIATEASVSRPAEEFRRKVRIACQAFNVNRALWPELMRLGALDRYKYLSHKYLRWLTIYLLSLSFVLALAAIDVWFGALVALFTGAIGVASGALIAVSQGGAAGQLREVLSAFTATGLGVWRSWRGETFQTWNPPASARAPAITAYAQVEARA
jgi:cellulose synthase/poly-beta-1,6-N-acetylglucosamine synthase-like glycosyltransferase